MARGGSAQIPLDDEPVDIDLGDLPTDEELEAAAAAGPAPEDEGGEPRYVERDTSPLALFQLWVVLVVLLYTATGFGVGLLLAFRGAAQIGFGALAHPSFYLVVVFWPIALWQLFWNQF